MAYTAWSVVFGETPSASKWNILGTNDLSFNNGTGIANNAIGTSQLASNAVTTVKITDASVTSAKIEAQQSWIAPTFTNSWVNYDGGTTFNIAGYMKDSLGFVHLRGLVKSGTVNTGIFTLPAGYRPEKQHLFSTICNNAVTRVDIQTNGIVLQSAGVSNTFQSLDGITFKAYA